MALSGAAAAAVVLGCLLAVLGAAVAAVLITIAFTALLVRPWDGDTQRDHRWATRAPFPVFWLVSWTIRWVVSQHRSTRMHPLGCCTRC